MIVEVMGRDTGWIALFSGVAGTADVILIPEIPYSIESVCAKVMVRERLGRHFTIIVAAEGALPLDGVPVFKDPEAKRLGGVCELLAEQVSAITGKEARAIALRHLQRGGSPCSYDRLIALRFGAAAVQCVEREEFGVMVALDPPNVLTIPLAEAVSSQKKVPTHGDVVETARAMGISFGD
jgi:6-phosphofructokinase 1